jgi:bifunctional DNase/RNase
MEMIEVVIDSVRVSLTNQQRIVLLREQNHDRYLPIWIGPFEAEAITIALQEIEVARPQTHDLLLKSIESLGARLIRVEVDALKGDVFYGKLVLDMNGALIKVDARPSDSIALAVRAHVPILANLDVLREAGIEEDADIQDELLSDGEAGREGDLQDINTEDTEGRLSLFEDFLQNINVDKPEDSEDKPDNPAPDSDDQD